MSFDRAKAQLRPTQLDVGEAADKVYEAVRAQLADTDEDPGEIDGDDILEIILNSGASSALTTILTAIAQSGGGLGIANLFSGAGMAFFNDNLDDFQAMADADGE